MQNLEIKRGKNIIVDKPYLQRFYQVEKPKWLLFVENLINDKFQVIMYLPLHTDSIYLTLIKNNKMLKIRYSSHTPKLDTYLKGNINLYVGPLNQGMLSERQVINAIKLYFRE